MYVELMKNFFLADSNELMVVRLISASWAKKTFDSYFFDMMYVELKKNFFLADSNELLAVRLISASEPKNVDFFFLDKVYVECMKNFLLADSSELMVLRLISASWERKRLIPTFLTWYTSSWRKIFFSPIRTSWWLLDSFRPPEPKNLWFLLFWHDVRGVDEKFSSRRFERVDGC